MRRLAWALTAAAFVFYVYLAWRHPAVYWYDATDRLAFRDQLIVGRWLPLIQVIVLLVSRATHDLLILRVLLAVIAALAALATFSLGARFFGPETGLISAALLASNLMFAALAIVPYPDVLFVALSLTALHQLAPKPGRSHFILGMLALNLACVTRYEGWILAALVAIAAAWQMTGRLSWRTAGKAAITAGLASLAPLAWLWLGVNAPGGVLAHLGAVIGFEQIQPAPSRFLPVIDLGYLRQFGVNFVQLLSWQLGLPLLVAGVLGWGIAMHSGKDRSFHILIGTFCVLDLSLMALWRPWGLDALRQTFIVLVFLILYSGNALVKLGMRGLESVGSLLQSSRWPLIQKWTLATAAACIVMAAAASTATFVGLAATDPRFAVPQQAGTWIAGRLRPGDAVWSISDQVFPAYALAAYTGLPFDSVLDQRLPQASIQTRIGAAQDVYVVALLAHNASLPGIESELVLALEEGTLPAERCPLTSVAAWDVRSAALLHWLGAR